MTTIATLFSGGEGVGVGAKAAGLVHLWGVEYDDAIASVARSNGFNTLTGNVMDTALMMSLPRPDVLHASPVCKNASNAKADGEESPLDIATADATCAYISHFRPDVFTLENVWGYRTFEAFAHILICLKRNGYTVDYWHLNAADYGVPQTRRRLILVARLHGKPIKPLATHARPDKITPMFDTRLPWIGWYQAIEDLIDTLPTSQFAPWQLERLPQEMIGSFVFEATDMRDDGMRVLAEQPLFTIKSQRHETNRAFIMPNANTSSGVMRYDDEPAPTQGNTDRVGNQPRAWLDYGRVVKMTPRALARFQSFPDWYMLPDKAKLACTVIGNAVPPLLYQRVIETQGA